MMLLQLFSPVPVFTAMMLLIPSLHALPAQETSLQPRGAGGTIFQGILFGLLKSSSNELQSVFGVAGPTCCDNAADSCRINAGKSASGHSFQACYDEGSEEIYDFDVEVMKCIINLHYTQADNCIDVKGSVCGANYGGGLMRGQMGWVGISGYSKSNQISAQDSATLQAAAESMRGVKIDYAKGHNSAVALNVVSDTSGLLSLEIDFDGHQGSDC